MTQSVRSQFVLQESQLITNIIIPETSRTDTNLRPKWQTNSFGTCMAPAPRVTALLQSSELRNIGI